MSNIINDQILEQCYEDILDTTEVQYSLILNKSHGGNVKSFSDVRPAQFYAASCDDELLRGCLVAAFVNQTPIYQVTAKSYLDASSKLDNAEEYVEAELERLARIEFDKLSEYDER